MALAVSSVLYVSAYAAPRIAFQVYAVRDLCEKDFVGTLKAAKTVPASRCFDLAGRMRRRLQ